MKTYYYKAPSLEDKVAYGTKSGFRIGIKINGYKVPHAWNGIYPSLNSLLHVYCKYGFGIIKIKGISFSNKWFRVRYSGKNFINTHFIYTIDKTAETFETCMNLHGIFKSFYVKIEDFI